VKRKTPLRRKTRLRAKSPKRLALDEKRRAFVAEQMAKRRWCEACERIGDHTGDVKVVGGFRRWVHCALFSTELHEPLTRARAPGPETILDPANSVAICPFGHRWIHDHPAAATQLGLLIPSGRLSL